MNKILIRVGAAVTTLAAVSLLVVPATMAAKSCTISGNGNKSHNTCNVTTNKTTAVTQVNTAEVVNGVVVVSGTGGNKASNNTGGSSSIDTGNANTTVNITNTVNSNVIGTP